jgi:hypothetical protein
MSSRTLCPAGPLKPCRMPTNFIVPMEVAIQHAESQFYHYFSKETDYVDAILPSDDTLIVENSLLTSLLAEDKAQNHLKNDMLLKIRRKSCQFLTIDNKTFVFFLTGLVHEQLGISQPRTENLQDCLTQCPPYEGISFSTLQLLLSANTAIFAFYLSAALQPHAYLLALNCAYSLKLYKLTYCEKDHFKVVSEYSAITESLNEFLFSSASQSPRCLIDIILQENDLILLTSDSHIIYINHLDTSDMSVKIFNLEAFCLSASHFSALLVSTLASSNNADSNVILLFSSTCIYRIKFNQAAESGPVFPQIDLFLFLHDTKTSLLSATAFHLQFYLATSQRLYLFQLASHPIIPNGASFTTYKGFAFLTSVFTLLYEWPLSFMPLRTALTLFALHDIGVIVSRNRKLFLFCQHSYFPIELDSLDVYHSDLILLHGFQRPLLQSVAVFSTFIILQYSNGAFFSVPFALAPENIIDFSSLYEDTKTEIERMAFSCHPDFYTLACSFYTPLYFNGRLPLQGLDLSLRWKAGEKKTFKASASQPISDVQPMSQFSRERDQAINAIITSKLSYLARKCQTCRPFSEYYDVGDSTSAQLRRLSQSQKSMINGNSLPAPSSFILPVMQSDIFSSQAPGISLSQIPSVAVAPTVTPLTKSHSKQPSRKTRRSGF